MQTPECGHQALRLADPRLAHQLRHFPTPLTAGCCVPTLTQWRWLSSSTLSSKSHALFANTAEFINHYTQAVPIMVTMITRTLGKQWQILIGGSHLYPISHSRKPPHPSRSSLPSSGVWTLRFISSQTKHSCPRTLGSLFLHSQHLADYKACEEWESVNTQGSLRKTSEHMQEATALQK